jgi:hypothetical protein
MLFRTLFLTTLSVLGLVSVKDCSTPSALFPLKALDISPSNPVPGENGTLHLTYSSPEDLAGGTVDYTCTVKNISTPLPLEGGTYILNTSATINLLPYP